jgi:hypothetical protein
MKNKKELQKEENGGSVAKTRKNSKSCGSKCEG